MTRILLILTLMVAGATARAAVDIQQVTSPGGLKAWLVEEPSIPFVALELRFRGGASLDREGKRGATNLMVGLLEEGTGDMDSAAFAEASEALAARFGFDAGDDTVSISAQFLTETQDEAIDLLRGALVAPRFDETSVDRVRRQVLSSIRSSLVDPSDIAGDAFNATLFGDHPYGTDPSGTMDSVSALTRDDIVQAHRDALARDRVTIAATGDIDAETLGRLLDRLLGDLPKTGAPMPQAPDMQIEGGVDVVEFETPQAVALFGHAGLSRDDPDFFAAYVLNFILGGGGFESRLMNEVREKRGLTYGIGSYLVTKDMADLYLGQVSSANDRIAEAIEVIRDEWARMSRNGPTQDELEKAQTYLTGAYPLRFDGNGPIAGILVGMQMQGLTPDYITTRNDRINAVTLEDVKRVAERILKPEDLRFVVVGQPEGL